MLHSINEYERPDPALVQRFIEVARCYSASCIFADVQGRDNVMHSGIKPIYTAKLVGPALTVKLSPGDLVDPLKALEMGRPGDVLVVDAGGETETSVCGGLMGGLAKNRGIAGMIIDGAARDVDELRDIAFPVFVRAITPRGTHTMFSGRKDELSINVPVTCGGVVVCPGDIVIGDEIGVTVVPRADAQRVLDLAREQAERERSTREWVSQGKTIEDLLAQFGRI
ncbi:RraA family protein [bacterium]|nr:MAG: RraA family protein [bacterium]